MYETIDPYYDKTAVDTYAVGLRNRRNDSVAELVRRVARVEIDASVSTQGAEQGTGVDVLALQKEAAINPLLEDEAIQEELKAGIAWGKVKALLLESLPENMDDRDTVAYNLVPNAISVLTGGVQDVTWRTERRGPRKTTYIIKM